MRCKHIGGHTMTTLFKKVNVTRKLFYDDVREVCIQNEYYTRGTVEEYSAMFDMIRSFSTIDDTQLFLIAQDIYNHSNIERIMNEGGVDECGVMESILFNLTEATHTFYTVAEEV